MIHSVARYTPIKRLMALRAILKVSIFLLFLSSLATGQDKTRIGFSASPLFLTHLPIAQTLRFSVSAMRGQKEVVIYMNYGTTPEETETKAGIQFRKYRKPFDQKSFFYGVEESFTKYDRIGERVNSKNRILNIGPRIGYSFPFLESCYLKPQVGLDLWLGLHISSEPLMPGIAMPIIFIFPDFQLEFGYAFQIGS